MSEFIEIPASHLSICQRKPVFGVGVNDADYITNPRTGQRRSRSTCPYYSRWIGMLERCYSKEIINRRPSYLGCTVCEEWLIFSNFKQWMETQVWDGLALDKDLKIPGNKEYSPAACVFIPIQLNSLLTGKHRNRTLPDGVDYRKQNSKYRARYSYKGKSVYLGEYKSKQEASLAYRKHKARTVLSYIDQFPELRAGLNLHACSIFIGGEQK